jgi:hypothetical protein
MAESTKEVATVDEKSKAVATYDYGADAGGGFENTTRDDFKLPFLRLLQPGSPQVESVDGAKAGMWINVVTNALFPDGIEFVPAITEHYYVEYERAEDGSRLPGGEGFRGIHKATDKMVLDAIAAVGDSKFVRDESTGKMVLPKSPDGYDLVETKYVHGVQHVRDTRAILPAVIAFSSTHLQMVQSLLTTARNEVIPGTSKSKPLFAHVYKLGGMKKTKGANTWWVPTVSFVGGSAKAALLDPTSDMYLAAKAVRDLVQQGRAKVDHAQSAAGDGGGKSDERVPF